MQALFLHSRVVYIFSKYWGFFSFPVYGAGVPRCKDANVDRIIIGRNGNIIIIILRHNDYTMFSKIHLSRRYVAYSTIPLHLHTSDTCDGGSAKTVAAAPTVTTRSLRRRRRWRRSVLRRNAQSEPKRTNDAAEEWFAVGPCVADWLVGPTPRGPPPSGPRTHHVTQTHTCTHTPTSPVRVRCPKTVMSVL